MSELTASISVGMTRQVRQFEPVNIHVSIQGYTAETPLETVEEFCNTSIPEAVKVIGKALSKQMNAELERLRSQSE